MKRRDLLIASVSVILGGFAKNAISSPTNTVTKNKHKSNLKSPFLKKASILSPILHEKIVIPLGVISFTKNPQKLIPFDKKKTGNIQDLSVRTFSTGDAFTLDLGEHCVGYFSFDLNWESGDFDAPIQLKVIFGETPMDIEIPFYPYNGLMSASWLPEEILNINNLPQRIEIKRRYSCRYINIKIMAASTSDKFSFKNITFKKISSANNRALGEFNHQDKLLKQIDEISISTLHDCMQSVFEDGPRRDQRMWVGDLRLQALVNYESFKDYNLVKRSLYLFAGLRNPDGYIAACIYEKPTPRASKIFILDYAAMFCCATHDYVIATNDISLLRELWDILLQQVSILISYVDTQGIFHMPDDVWIFIDWESNLNKQASMQGVIIYTLNHMLDLAQLINKKDSVEYFMKHKQIMIKAAYKEFYNGDVFVSGPNKQISVASQAWLTLAGVGSQKEQQKSLISVINSKDSVKPLTPYLTHYLIDALISCGLKDEAKEYLKKYWGAMANAGADTFWEAYDGSDTIPTPYKSIHLNSYCHAWSCTPAYFIRKKMI